MKKAGLNFLFDHFMRYWNLFNPPIKNVLFLLNPQKIYLDQNVSGLPFRKCTSPKIIGAGLYQQQLKTSLRQVLQINVQNFTFLYVNRLVE